MKGYVAKKGNRWYAVIYQGIDPVTGRERRSWHPAGAERADAERLAARLAAELDGRNDDVRSLSFGAFLDQPLAARQAVGGGRHHVRRLPPQRREPHRPRARSNLLASAAATSPRDLLRRAAASTRRSPSTGTQDGLRDAPRRSERNAAQRHGPTTTMREGPAQRHDPTLESRS